MNEITGIGLFLLQRSDWFKDPDQGDLIQIAIALGILVVVIIVIGVISRFVGGSSGGSKGGRRYSLFTMRRIASDYGLSGSQRSFLETIFKGEGIGDPTHFIQSHEAMDRLFIRAIKNSERTSQNMEQHERYVSNIFTLRNIFESAPANADGSFGELAANSSITLTSGNDSYVVKVISSGKSGVVIEPPKAKYGSPINLVNGTSVSIFCKMNSPQGFSVDAKVYGTKTTDAGSGIQLAYTGNPKSLAQRRFRRKDSKAICNVFMVRAENMGSRRKKNTKLIAGKKNYRSTLLNISVGGCAIHTDAPAHGGSVLKLEFLFTRDAKISVLGQVLRSNRSSSSGTIVHVKFVRIPRRAFNEINYLIFGYNLA